MRRQYLHIVGTVLLVVIVVPFALFAVPQVAGTPHSYVVSSSSMSPAIQAGDAVFVDDVRPANIEQGDIITFKRLGGGIGQQSGTERVTHRVVEVVERDGGRHFRTKGDANEEADPQLVSAGNVIGEVEFTIPYIGWVISFAGSKVGLIMFAVIPMIALVVSELWNLYSAARASSEEDADESPETTDD